MRWPGVIRAGSECAVPISSPDFYPTLLEAAGLPPMPAQHVDGVSMMPLFRGGALPLHDALFWHYPHYGNQGGTPGCSIRSGDWKLIEFFEDNHVELFNLKSDPGETVNVADQNPQVTRDLRAKLTAWRNRCMRCFQIGIRSGMIEDRVSLGFRNVTEITSAIRRLVSRDAERGQLGVNSGI